MPKYYVPNLVLLNKTRTTIALAIITIVTAIPILAATVPKPALALAPPTCQNCGAQESITGNGIGTLTCSNSISHTNTQITFNAIVPFKTVGPAKGTVTLTAAITSAQIQGMVTSGQWNPSAKTYFISGTTTSDNICGIPGSPFTVSGIIGPSVPITMDSGGKYSLQGTGNVAASNAKA
jgi:hypothetical protein